MNKLVVTILILCTVVSAFAQIGIGTQTPDASSELEISSVDKGLLVPRLSSQDLISSPAEGLLIYNTTQGKFYFFNGTDWQEISPFNYRQGSNGADEDDLIMNFNNNRFLGIDAASPDSKLSVAGNAAIGSNYANNNAAPADGLIVEGNVGIGTSNPGTDALEVNGTTQFTGNMNITGTLTATVGSVPIGLISMWSGSPNSLPTGWALCDGTTTYSDFLGVTRTVPDLRGRFIVGYNPLDTDYNAIGDTGGAKTVTLTTAQIPSHSHSGSATSSGSAHSHAIDDRIRGDEASSGGGLSRTASESNTTTTSNNTKTDGAHTHGLSINNTGGGDPHQNRPPYYTLAYIIKIQ
ncbi:MAG: hypothetical protein AAF693_00075 [Bacteroidota bacterium]